MTHHSRLCALLFDGPAETHEQSIEFWSGALGRRVLPTDESDPAYASLERDEHLPLDLMVQRVPEAETALHVDIETDDVHAEVRRLERLGARRKRQVKTWWVMEDPAGHAFCVVRVQQASKATWPQGAVEWKE